MIIAILDMFSAWSINASVGARIRSKSYGRVYRQKKDTFLCFFDAGDYSQATRCINNVPTADVIERSKIDKAIAEIKQDMIAHSGTGEEVIQAYRDGLKKALEYLDNIGE